MQPINPTPVNITVATGEGTVPTGARSIGFSVTGFGPATIAGASVPSGTSFAVNGLPGRPLASVAYNATGTTLVIVRLD